MSRRPARLALLLIAGALAACTGSPRKEIASLSELGGGDTLVVGRVELVPPLRKDEQRLRGPGTGSYENKLLLITDEKHRVLMGEPVAADYRGRIEAALGKTFFVRSEAKPFFILGGVVFLDLGGSAMNRAYFPGGLRAPVRAEDKAVYIGTLRYHRNEFFEITKVSVDDDYERANAEFRKKFGTKDSLRKALLTRAK